MDTSDLAKRMKDYEQRNRYYLQRRLPVIIRLDMRAGHSFTKGFQRPFDEVFMKTMQHMAKYICENTQNCKLAYVQSDECTLILTDYDKLNTDSFFDYRVDKLCSITASMATMVFNKIFVDNYLHYMSETEWNFNTIEGRENYRKIQSAYNKSSDKGAMFDARCFNIPKEEVTNCLYWRQLDASRNSIQMVGQANFTHKELQNKSCNEIQDMLMTQKGINWNDLPTYQKRGSCVVRNKIVVETGGVTEICELRDSSRTENEWIIDTNIPIFKGEGREYIDKLIYIGDK